MEYLDTIEIMIHTEKALPSGVEKHEVNCNCYSTLQAGLAQLGITVVNHQKVLNDKLHQLVRGRAPYPDTALSILDSKS